MDTGTLPPTVREFEFTSRDFERIRSLLLQNIGISLSPSKTELVYSRVTRRLRATGMRSFSEYLAALDPQTPEWEQFVNALTTNLTSFFREAHHFTRLARLLPTLPKPVTIWCSACSTGEEAYSIAMVAVETFESLAPPVSIIASDVDTNVIATARAGVYTTAATTGIGAARLERFFLRGKGKQEGNIRVRPEIHKLIDFRRINLLDQQWGLNGPLGAIFCRNVLIYFDRDVQHRVLTSFTPLLAPEGRLFLGHSETIKPGTLPLENEGQTVYAPMAAASARSGGAR